MCGTKERLKNLIQGHWVKGPPVERSAGALRGSGALHRSAPWVRSAPKDRSAPAERSAGAIHGGGNALDALKYHHRGHIKRHDKSFQHDGQSDGATPS